MQERTVSDIRETFRELFDSQRFVSLNREKSMSDIVGSSTIEIVGASFVADEDVLFGQVNWDYVKREEEWYTSQSLNVNDIPGTTPAIWKAVADKDGYINSNYGHLVYSSLNVYRGLPISDQQIEKMSEHESGYMSQYKFAVKELKENPASRRALMIYTRPNIWLDYNKDGMSDFICTNAVQYLIRDGAVHAVVQMRSNDGIFGFRNDLQWQKHVLKQVTDELNIPVGKIYWQVGSLHLYAKDYYLVDHFSKTGEIHITKKDYIELYPNSPYSK